MTKTTLGELDEKYKDCPQSKTSYCIDGKEYSVTRHFVGDKDINKIIGDIAFEKALRETLNIAAQDTAA